MIGLDGGESGVREGFVRLRGGGETWTSEMDVERGAEDE